MKRFKSLLAVLLVMLMLPTVVSAAGADEMVLGEKGTYFGYVWSNTDGAENLYKPFTLSTGTPSSESAAGYTQPTIEIARKMKTYFDTVPEGKRVLNPANSLSIMIEERTNHVWYDIGTERYLKYLDEVFYYYKRLGGVPLDYYMMDFERYCNVWYLEGKIKPDFTWDDLMGEIISDPRYPELREHLIKGGVKMYEGSDHTELYWMHAHMNDTPPNDPTKESVYNGIEALDSWVVTNYIQRVYEKMDEIFPGIKFSDYSCSASNVPNLHYTSFGHNYGYFLEPEPVEGRKYEPGTHMSPTLYLQFRPGLETAGPPEYKYSKFYSTPFNNLLYYMVAVKDSLLYMPGQIGFAPWVGSYSWSYANYGTMCATDYYKEFIYHLGLMKPDPFLFYNYESGQQGIVDNLVFSELLEDLDEVVGFADREYIIDEVPDWNDRYILTGMKAGGRNVWRLTPDLTTDDITIESFKVKDSPLTFKVGQQVIEFPEGSFIYEPSRDREYGWYSEAGYWIITPDGTEPKEYTDSSAKELKEPVYTWGGTEEQAERVAAYFERMGAAEEEKADGAAVMVDLAAEFKKMFSKSYRDVFVSAN